MLPSWTATLRSWRAQCFRHGRLHYAPDVLNAFVMGSYIYAPDVLNASVMGSYICAPDVLNAYVMGSYIYAPNVLNASVMGSYTTLLTSSMLPSCSPNAGQITVYFPLTVYYDGTVHYNIRTLSFKSGVRIIWHANGLLHLITK